jgi:hypothetical protein
MATCSNLLEVAMDYNNLFKYKDGDLYWIEKSNSLVPAGTKAGTLRKDGYVGIFIKGTYHFAHRIIWEMHNGEIPSGLTIDHVDRNRSNNNISNLRLCTFQQNHFNRSKQINNKSGFKGVSWHKQKGKWVAQIKIEGKNKFLGFFNDPEKAYEKYCEKAIEHYGEFARID